jgi:hypothetical protein
VKGEGGRAKEEKTTAKTPKGAKKRENKKTDGSLDNERVVRQED